VKLTGNASARRPGKVLIADRILRQLTLHYHKISDRGRSINPNHMAYPL